MFLFFFFQLFFSPITPGTRVLGFDNFITSHHHHYFTHPLHHPITTTSPSITTTSPIPSPLLHPSHHHHFTHPITTTSPIPSPILSPPLYPSHHHHFTHPITHPITTTPPSPPSMVIKGHCEWVGGGRRWEEGRDGRREEEKVGEVGRRNRCTFPQR